MLSKSTSTESPSSFSGVVGRRPEVERTVGKEQPKLRIVQVVPELNAGGVERGTIEFAREIVKRGHESWVISHGGKLVERLCDEGSAHVQLDVCSKNPLSAPWRIPQLRRALEKISPDIVHARSRIPAWLTRFANRRFGIPFITTVHGMNSISRYSRIMVEGDHVIAVGETVRDYVCEAYDVPREEITVIDRGVDIAYFDPTIADASWADRFRSWHGLTDHTVLTCVGRITRTKNIEGFIDSLALLKQRQERVKGLVVGSVHPRKQTYYDTLVERARAAGVERDLVFAGGQTKMREIYLLSDIIVNAMAKMGNTGRTITEALAMNTPVLASDNEATRDVIVDGVNGYRINPSDPTDIACRAEQLIAHTPQDVRQNLPTRLTLDAMVEHVLSVYYQALSYSELR